MASTELIERATRGELPEWAEASESRREHMRRVSALLGEWAEALGLPAAERVRWRAVGWLHDALREADPSRLREELPARFRDFPDRVLHGPAAAERLGGSLDPEMLDAIRFHTVGHPDLAPIGRALYLADFLEPARKFDREWRAELRARMPREMDRVLLEVMAYRIRHILEERRPIRPETIKMWNSRVALAG